jgi:hypothetical protein
VGGTHTLSSIERGTSLSTEKQASEGHSHPAERREGQIRTPKESEGARVTGHTNCGTRGGTSHDSEREGAEGTHSLENAKGKISQDMERNERTKDTYVLLGVERWTYEERQRKQAIDGHSQTGK